MITFLKNLFTGILIGAGAILPGISSGVILISFGLYENLLNSILYFFKNIKLNLKLLIPLIVGTILGIVLFGNILNKLYINYPNFLKFTFIGLILGTIQSIFKTASKQSKYLELKYLLYVLCSFLVTILMILTEKNMNANLITTQFNYFYLILSGFLMSIGIVVPRYK